VERYGLDSSGSGFHKSLTASEAERLIGHQDVSWGESVIRTRYGSE
jgi:hypothetical protein